MYVVYILQSNPTGKYYVGHSNNFDKRLSQHNSGKVRSTKPYKPWKLVYLEDYDTKQLAYKREMQIKSYKGGRAFKELINSDGGVA